MFCLIFPINEAFDLWSATLFEYNSGGDTLSPGDHSKKKHLALSGFQLLLLAS